MKSLFEDRWPRSTYYQIIRPPPMILWKFCGTPFRNVYDVGASGIREENILFRQETGKEYFERLATLSLCSSRD